MKRETIVESRKGKTVYDALTEGLDKMKRKGTGRVILSIYESEPSKDATGKWLNVDKDTRYYPFEMLQAPETEMILNGKTYTIDALINEDIGNERHYPQPGIEQTKRTKVCPMLPRLIPESELNYITEIVSLHEDSDLKNLGQYAEKNGWTYDSTRKMIESGIAEWDRKTLELMENRGVNNSLQKIEERGCSSIDNVLYKMRENMPKGDKK